MAHPPLHELVKRGDVSLVRAYFTTPERQPEGDINAYDAKGYTPLMLAVKRPEANVELVQALLQNGADPHLETHSRYGTGRSVIALALSAGDPATVQLLLQHGADIHYKREHNYTALIDAVHSRDVFNDERLLDLLRLLMANAVELNAVTSYGESGCRVLSRLGRFDAVGLLLDAGADMEQLRWTPLPRAVALGSLADVQNSLGHGGGIEDKDYWERTPWLLAIQTGDIDKARLLREHGADTQAHGRCGKPPLFYATESQRQPMLRWLLAQGASVEGTDEFGSTPLMHAAEASNAGAVEEILKAGARVDAKTENGQTALSFTTAGEVAWLLLRAGADPSKLSFEARRSLAGLSPEIDESLFAVSTEEFQEGRSRRFGISNPEKMAVPFWTAMIRSGITGYQATMHFEGEMKWGREPVWCAQRFGQSISFLPDGRIIQIAGEHEDSYDPDFCIYNDVFVHHPDGTVDIYGYPETVFPPTDFHTATLLGRFIYLIGSLGYAGSRKYGHTPVYRLDTESLHMEAVHTMGNAPGWINGHVAVARSENEIRVTGGTTVTLAGGEETHSENTRTFVLDIGQNSWSIVDPG